MINSKITRFTEDDIIEYDNEKMYRIREQIKIKKDNTDGEYSVKQGDTLRSIADNVYSDARLYWVIAEFNNIIDPFAEIEIGKKLKHPSLKRIMEEIY